MKRILLGITTLLITMLLVACNEDLENIENISRYNFESIRIQSTDEKGQVEIEVKSKDKEEKIYYSILENGKEVPNKNDLKSGADSLDFGSGEKGVLSQTKTFSEGGVEYLVAVATESGAVYSMHMTTKKYSQEEMGLGTKESPFKVREVSDLEKISTGEDGFTADSYYVLENDIDILDGGYKEGVKSWEPIGRQNGSNQKFIGSFDGNNHTISNLYIFDTTGTEKWGLFGEMGLPTLGDEFSEGSPSIIKNLNLENVDVTSTGFRIAGLVGYSKGNIQNVHVLSGQITGVDAGDQQVGGLVGTMYEKGFVSRSSVGNVTVNGNGRRVGGLAGSLDGSAEPIKIWNSYSNATVVGNSRQVGALIGYAVDTIIEDSYASGSVQGDRSIGGIVGYYQEKNQIGKTYIRNTAYLGTSIKATGAQGQGSDTGFIVAEVNSTTDSSRITNNYYNQSATQTKDDASKAINGIKITGSFDENLFKNTLNWVSFDAYWVIKDGLPVLKGGLK